ncbi:hypothetical protein ES332_D04G027100v1 [Gossypium tomentosum]|uniref:Uncharacterized protein n=1 Tax=Gossypium tomentosum TaxID=34277 RepID=A0A5D2L967_GOSTO|nr:hypothetical protein ES332_D04G027100v1 [Gossypium tomentosum]
MTIHLLSPSPVPLILCINGAVSVDQIRQKGSSFSVMLRFLSSSSPILASYLVFQLWFKSNSGEAAVPNGDGGCQEEASGINRRDMHC